MFVRHGWLGCRLFALGAAVALFVATPMLTAPSAEATVDNADALIVSGSYVVSSTGGTLPGPGARIDFSVTVDPNAASDVYHLQVQIGIYDVAANAWIMVSPDATGCSAPGLYFGPQYTGEDGKLLRGQTMDCFLILNLDTAQYDALDAGTLSLGVYINGHLVTDNYPGTEGETVYSNGGVDPVPMSSGVDATPLVLTKTVSFDPSSPGSTSLGIPSASTPVTYHFVVTYSGELTLPTDIYIDDTAIGWGVGTTDGPIDCKPATLTGVTWTATCDVTMSIASLLVDGSFDNSAFAYTTADDGTGGQYYRRSPQSSPATVYVMPTTGLKLTKTIVGSTTTLEEGETVTYQYVVTNEGDTSVDYVDIYEYPGITVSHGSAHLDQVDDLDCGSGNTPGYITLAANGQPGSTVTCTVKYELMSGDVGAVVDNEAEAVGFFRTKREDVTNTQALYDSSRQVSAFDSADFTVVLPTGGGTYGLDMTVTADPDPAVAGGPIEFTYVITNIGNSYIMGLRINRLYSGSGNDSFGVVCYLNDDKSYVYMDQSGALYSLVLAPGDQLTCMQGYDMMYPAPGDQSVTSDWTVDGYAAGYDPGADPEQVPVTTAQAGIKVPVVSDSGSSTSQPGPTSTVPSEPPTALPTQTSSPAGPTGYPDSLPVNHPSSRPTEGSTTLPAGSPSSTPPSNQIDLGTAVATGGSTVSSTSRGAVSGLLVMAGLAVGVLIWRRYVPIIS